MINIMKVKEGIINADHIPSAEKHIILQYIEIAKSEEDVFAILIDALDKVSYMKETLKERVKELEMNRNPAREILIVGERGSMPTIKINEEN